MPTAIAISIRRKIIERRQQGERFTDIARELKLSYGTVRNIWRQFQTEGQLPPHYDRCRHTAIRKGAALYASAVQLKQDHPGWGAGLIRLELAVAYPTAALPSERTVQRWFRRAGVGRKPIARRPPSPVQRGKQPHEVWALDAKEQMQLGDGSYCSWLTITDEGSGAILNATLFPHSALESGRTAGRQAGVASDHEPMGAAETDTHG
jgi:transposase